LGRVGAGADGRDKATISIERGVQTSVRVESRQREIAPRKTGGNDLPIGLDYRRIGVAVVVAADRYRDLTVGIKGNIEAAVGIVSRQGKLASGADRILSGDDDLPVRLQHHAVSLFPRCSEGCGEFAVAIEAGVQFARPHSKGVPHAKRIGDANIPGGRGRDRDRLQSVEGHAVHRVEQYCNRRRPCRNLDSCRQLNDCMAAGKRDHQGIGEVGDVAASNGSRHGPRTKVVGDLLGVDGNRQRLVVQHREGLHFENVPRGGGHDGYRLRPVQRVVVDDVDCELHGRLPCRDRHDSGHDRFARVAALERNTEGIGRIECAATQRGGNAARTRILVNGGRA